MSSMDARFDKKATQSNNLKKRKRRADVRSSKEPSFEGLMDEHQGLK